MMLSRSFLILGVGLLCACGIATSQQFSYVLDEELKKVVSNPDTELSKARTGLEFSNKKIAKDCLSYYRYGKNEAIVESVNNQFVKSEYLMCDALEVLSSAEDYSGEVDTQSIGEALMMRLDLRSFVNSMSRAADDVNFTFNDIFPAEARVIGAGVVLDLDDWVLTLRTVAVVDVNKNGLQDWVVQMADESKDGNYRHYTTLIVFDPEKNGVMSATTFPQI